MTKLPLRHPSTGIRRAIQLRSLLKKNGRISEGLADVSDAVVYALLTVDRYRHGVRSMQAIVEMCTPIYGRIEIASLPSRAQLNMHVDAEEFLIRVHRGRVRARPNWNPMPKTEIASALHMLKKYEKHIDQTDRDSSLAALLSKTERS